MHGTMRAALGLLGFLAVGVNAPAMARDDDEGLAAKDRTAAALQMPGVKRSAGADEGRRAGKAAASGKDDDDEREGGAKQEDKLDTEDIFGFTEGSSEGEVGEKQISTDFIGRFSKRGALFLVPQVHDNEPPLAFRARGSYAAVGNITQLEYVATDYFKFSLGGAFAYHNIRNIEGLDNRTSFNFDGIGTEFKFQLLKLDPSPIGIAVSFAPRWNRVEDISGARADTYSLETKLMADTEIIPEKLFAALNLSYTPHAQHVRTFDPDTALSREWERDSEFEASAALSGAVTEKFFLGAEARFLTHYQGVFFDRFEGRAWFLGPTAYLKLSEKAFIKAAWSFQVSGHAADTVGESLDLTNYERHQVRIKFGLNF